MEQIKGRDSVHDIKLSLQEFLESFPPPQMGRIVEGYTPEFDTIDAFNIQKGAVLKFHNKANTSVLLSFRDPWSGGGAGDWVKVTLPVESSGKFKLFSYDPPSDDHSLNHIYETVEDLIAAFPIYVQANSSYGDKQLYPTDSFDSGDHLKLIRLVFRSGEKSLECRLLTESRLLLLPLDCVGNFTALPDQQEYMLADLAAMVPRRRRLRLSSDLGNKPHRIPGLPAKFDGDMFMEEPNTFVEASPVNEPGLIIGLPHDINMQVSPDEMAFDRGQLLNHFAVINRNLFPVVVRVTDWDEETSILENHYVRPGVELVMHGWTRQSKILARSKDRYFAIPLTYQGLFKLKPQTFFGVSDLENAHPSYKLRVKELDDAYPDVPVAIGDILLIKREDPTSKKNNRNEKDGEIKFLRCEKVDSFGKGREVHLPMAANMEVEEVLADQDQYLVRELVTFVTEQETTVELIQPSTDQKYRDRDLPVGKPIVLCDFVVEPAVYVSVDQPSAPAFHVPLRTLLYVTVVEQLEMSSSPLLTKQNPKLSTLDRCVEVLPLDVYNALKPHGQTESPLTSTELPVINHSTISPMW